MPGAAMARSIQIRPSGASSREGSVEGVLVYGFYSRLEGFWSMTVLSSN